MDQQEVTLDQVRVLASSAGMSLGDEELEGLLQAYSSFKPLVDSMHEVDLNDGDLAVSFTPDWDPES